MRQLLSILLVFVLLMLSAPAFAGNANSFFVGNDAAMTAGSIAAVVRDAESIWYNPAGLGGNELTRLDLSGNVFMWRLQNIRSGMQVELPSGTYDQDIQGNEFLAVPAAMTFARRASDTISYGFGVYVPQYQDVTFNNSFDSNETIPGIAEPVTYTQGFNQDTSEMEYDLGGGFGWKVSPTVRIGGSLFFLYDRSRFYLTQFEDIQSADGSRNTSIFFVDSVRELIKTIGVRATAGVQWDFAPQWRLGVVAYSPTFQIYSWGETSVAAGGSGIDAQGRVISQAVRTTSNIHRLSGDMVDPFHALISLAYVRPDLWVGIAADFYLPLHNAGLLVDKKFCWNVMAGSKFKLSEKFNMGVGFFTDNSDNGGIAHAGEAQVNYYGLTVGGEFRTPVSRGEEGTSPIVFSSTLAARYALGVGSVGGEVFNPLTDGNLSNARVRSVDVLFNELSLYIGTSLFF